MEQDTFMVLRVTGAERASDPLKGYDWRSGTPAESLREIEYRVEVHQLDPSAQHELRRDRKVVEMAQLMPLRLIKPLAEPALPAKSAHVYGATWGVYVTGALSSPYVGRGVTVAILDTGIDTGHPAFEGVELIQRDFTGDGDGDGDRNGHGTHVAGTIFGQTVQGLRYGVAPGVRRVLIGKVIGAQGAATTAELVEAIEWAVKEGAHVVNMSLGIDFPGQVQWLVDQGWEVDLATSQVLAQYRDNVRFLDALIRFQQARAALGQAALIVAAAGNDSKRQIRPDYVIEASLPAAAQGIVAVAALQSAGLPHDALAVAPFSNTRAAVAGPGVGVYSAWRGGGYTVMSGTSMASPHVAGVAALWAERQLQRNGVVDVGSLGAQLRASARYTRLPNADPLDVGDGLVAAPPKD